MIILELQYNDASFLTYMPTNRITHFVEVSLFNQHNRLIYIPFTDKAYDLLTEWVTNAEIVTAKDMENALKNFIGNVNNVYSILDSPGAIKKLKDWEKVPSVAKKGLKRATKVFKIISLTFVITDTTKEAINDYDAICRFYIWT